MRMPASRIAVFAAVVAAATVLPVPGTHAAPPASPGPAAQTRTTVLENERVRAQVNDYPPGSKGPEHAHLVPRVVVVLEGGTLEIRGAAGDVKTLHLEPGDVVWRPAERHSIANSGTTPVRVVEIDLKDCPAR
jgi:quercetin dioxygenase-like cupin family protein